MGCITEAEEDVTLLGGGRSQPSPETRVSGGCKGRPSSSAADPATSGARKKRGVTPLRCEKLCHKDALTTGSLTDCRNSFLFLEEVQLH